MAPRSSHNTPDKASDKAPASLDDVAEELYGLPPEEFTTARNQHEKNARQAGDRALAASIHALPKPSVTAWLANQIAREHRDELQPLLELGAGLREATRSLAGDQLQELSRQQHELIYALVQQGRQLARACGHSVSEDTARGLQDTLHAALADEAAAEQLLAGRLTTTLERAGFGDIGAEPVDTGGRRSSEPKEPTEGDAAAEERLRRAERDVAEGHRALTDAGQARDEAQARATEADDVREKAQEQVEQLRRQLAQVSAAAEDADRRRREAIAGLRRAEVAVSDAERRHTDAQQRRDRLAGNG